VAAALPRSRLTATINTLLTIPVHFKQGAFRVGSANRQIGARAVTNAFRDRHNPLNAIVPFASAVSFWEPQATPSSSWTEHAPFAFWLVEALKPRSIVELGVHHGFSYFAMCQAVRALALDTRCFGVDRWTGDEQAGFYGDDVYQAVCRHNRRYAGFSTLIRSDFAAAGARLADGSIDLLHIDGFHSYAAVRHDFETWRPKLSRRGVVLFHDTAEFRPGFGVHRLWAELSVRHPHFAFTHGHGLGVLGIGDDIPDSLRTLFDADPACADDVRRFYQRLGLAQRAREFDLRVRALEQAVAGYQASASWKVTAPLRSVKRLIRSALGLADALRGSEVLSDEIAQPLYRPQSNR